MHVLPNSNVKFKEKTMIVVVGQCNVSTQAPGGRGGGRASPKNTKNKQNGNARIQELLKPVSVMENCHT